MKSRTFPPGVGWLPWAAALAVMLLVSFLAAVPHYTKKTLASEQNPQTGAPGAPVTQANGPASQPGNAPANGSQSHAGTQGTSGHYVSNGNSAPGATGPHGASKNITCDPGHNGGATDVGVSPTSITIATTDVTSGVGAGFLGEAADGIRAAVNQVNHAGGVCGRQINLLPPVNTGWDEDTGRNDISNFVHSGQVFALVAEPDSEGLEGALKAGVIDTAGIPVVGTDGMLADQYRDPWIWPVAASTVTNMHIIADYAYRTLGVHSADEFGIVYDSYYKFGAEGAAAFDNEVKRLTGQDIPGYSAGKACGATNKQFCGINGNSASEPSQTEVSTFTSACANKCKAVVMLLEPSPMETWMGDEQGAGVKWYDYLFGGEPLFDDNLGQNCSLCGGDTRSNLTPMRVWTGYKPAIQPFDADPAVSQFCSALRAVRSSDDCHNEFTEGAYLGTRLFIQAVQDCVTSGLPLTRGNLRAVLNGRTFDLGLASGPLHYGTGSLHLTNSSMAEFQENYSGTFNGWSYLNTSFLADQNAKADM